MAERSPFANIMLFLILIALIVGFAFTINAIDLWRLREEALITAVQGMKSDIGRLADAVQGGGFVLGTAEAPRPGMPFANTELRDPDAVEGDAIVMALPSETHNLNYIVNNESSVGDFWEWCNDTVAERSYINPDEFQPMLGERWEISDDAQTITVHLRKGVLWHDFTDPTTGERFENVEVTAEDFQFFIDVVRNPGIPCDPLRNYYQDMASLEVLDKYTFRVTWSRPYWKSIELTLGLSPLPKHFYRFDPAEPDDFTENTDRNRMIVGCGAWVFDNWDKGKEIAFRRNEQYYAPKPHLKRRVLRVIKEPNARFQALRNGELDRIGLTPEQWVDQAVGPEFDKKFLKFQYPSRSYSYIGYNMANPMFKDRLTRLALTHLVNRQRILDEVYRGLGRITTGPFFVESSSYDSSVQPWPFDVNKAKTLLAEAGWRDMNGDGIVERNGQPFQFTFMIGSSSPNAARIAEIWREDCAKAGILVNINAIDWAIYTQRLDEKNFDVCFLGWSLPWEQDPYQLWHSSQIATERGSNHVSFNNPEADRLIEAARPVLDVEKRIEIYHQFHRILHEEQPYTFLIVPDALVAQDNRFRNAEVYPLGMDLDTFWVPEAEQKYRE